MEEALDITAMTNPAFCGLVLYSFLDGYYHTAQTGTELALAFLPIPMALSSTVASRFSGTNVSTGLLEWVSRNPSSSVDLPEIVRKAVPISRVALIFSLQQGIIELTDDGKLIPCKQKLKRTPKDPLGTDISAKPFTIAKRLGIWCGSIGSTTAVLISLRMRP